MSNEKVILFPKLKQNSPPQSLEEVLEAIKDNRVAYVDDVADELSQYVIIECQNAGFDLDSNNLELVSSVHLMVESIRAILFRLSNMEHPLHSLSEELYLDEIEKESKTVVDFEVDVE